MSSIHPTAIIDPSAELAESVVVGPGCVIGQEVRIGAGTLLHNHVTVQSLTTIGCDNEVYPFAVLGADPQDRKYRGERSWCTIGDRNAIREHVTIHRGTSNGGGYTRIGDDNLIMVAAHIAHDCVVGNHTTIANQVLMAGHVRVEDAANIGGGVGVHHFVTVGAGSFVGGLARVPKDVPPFMLMEGNPAEVRGVNTIGMTRLGFRPEQIEAVKEAYKRLFRVNEASMREKISDLRRDYADVAPVIALCDALDAAARGVHGRAAEINRQDDKWAVVA